MNFTEENVLNLGLRKMNKEKRYNLFIKKIYEHKWISMIVVSLIILSTINAIMIYNFFKILQNI